ncbi:GTPase [Leptolyngbya sp. NIES-2104]|uniref:GTPase n=1 Tax=Leptolyngbya sp. NIES-2104 TaxID=1552121 RepID=UPI0006EC8089|nr:GTPase [Leptolyngbya sp. NIES-2104]GAP95945.1 hypothetical protein NIES2104_24740 [Leptolyngbya sp. NIES-2104]
MEDFKRVDIQCENILAGLTQLEEYIQEPIANEALELGKNSEATKNQELLQRIRRSLIQYKNRGKDLVYVGFMGHFSTGKSSTINSLLNLGKDSKTYRTVGLNPVDKDITLITHEDNNDSIFKVTREGLVSIRSNFINHDFLTNIVLADTPGTGDPQDFQEIAKDFLPICDLILYFFSAASPLDQADVALLREKHSQLEFVPMRFVVTRTDEFRKDEFSKLIADNFDHLKAASFKGSLSQRINQVLNTALTSDTDEIMFIDNKSKIRLEDLKDYILQFSDIANVDVKMQIHSHKVEYFRSSAEVIQNFFCDFISRKIRNISMVVQRARTNIDDFQNRIQVTNNELTDFWSKKLTNARNVHSKVLENTSAFESRFFDMSEFWITDGNIKAFRNRLKSEAQDRSDNLMKNLRIESLSRLESEFYRRMSEVDSRSLSSERIYNILKIPYLRSSSEVSSEGKLESSDLLPSDVTFTDAKESIQRIYEFFVQHYSDLNDCIEKLYTHLTSRTLIKECENILIEVTQSLSSDMDAFFDSVKLYRSAVFSLQAKDLIAKLGLGQRMDDLEAQDLTEEEKERSKRNAQDYIFPGKDTLFSEHSSQLSSIQRDLGELRQQLREDVTRRLNASKDINYYGGTSSTDRLRELAAELEREVEEDINNNLIPEINSKIQQQINQSVLLWKQEIKKLKEERVKKFFYAILIGVSITLTLYILYIYFIDKNMPSNLFATIVVGILVNFASGLLTFLIARIIDKFQFPVSVEKKEREIVSSLQQKCIDVIKSDIQGFKGKSFDEYRFPQLMQAFWEELLLDQPLNYWAETNSNIFDVLRVVSQKYSRFRQNYFSVSKSVTGFVAEYFANPRSNLDKLEEVTSNLKQTSIEPSFALLSDTESALKTVKSKIQAIRL